MVGNSVKHSMSDVVDHRLQINPEVLDNYHMHVMQADRVYLSQKDMDCIRLVAEGKSNRDVAKEMHCSEKTLKNRLSNLYRVFNVAGRPGLLSFAFKSGLIK